MGNVTNAHDLPVSYTVAWLLAYLGKPEQLERELTREEENLRYDRWRDRSA